MTSFRAKKQMRQHLPTCSVTCCRVVDGQYEHTEYTLEHIRLMALQSLACEGNTAYYEKNYDHNFCEIDAEKHGFLCALEFCKSLFPDKISIIEQKVVDIYNYKSEAEKYWLYSIEKNRFNSIEDIKNAFDEKIMSVLKTEFLNQPTVYSLFQNKYNQTIDAVMNKLYQSNNEHAEWRIISDKLDNATGYDADKKLASLVAYFNPEVVKKYYPVLSNEDLSIEANFGISFESQIQRPINDSDRHHIESVPVMVTENESKLSDFDSQIKKIVDSGDLKKNLDTLQKLADKRNESNSVNKQNSECNISRVTDNNDIR